MVDARYEASESPTGFPELPINIAELCVRFDDEWSSGAVPRLEDLLVIIDDESQSSLFRELLAIELSHRSGKGTTPEVGEYLARFPQYGNEVDSQFNVFLLGTDVDPQKETVEWKNGQKPTPIRSTVVPSLQSGMTIGRYRLEQRAGRGGFGEVWKAYDPELDRIVAIKLTRTDRRLAEDSVDALREEARKAAALKHAGIVPVYDVGCDRDELFIVSEFVDGQSLATRIQMGRVPVFEAVSIVIQIAEALHHAHTNDFVHRDVKPGNILLRPSGEALLTDFGVAVSEDEQLHEPDGTVGTRNYMSPEQARGQSNRVDARTDVYGLGVVLYELLSGRLPFLADDPEEYESQLVSRPPRPLRTLDDSIDPELERICLKCLEKSMADRFTTCRDLATALNEHLQASGELYGVSQTHGTAPVRRHTKTLFGAVIAVGLAVLGVSFFAFGFSGWKADKTKPALGDGFNRSSVKAEPPKLKIGPHWTPLLGWEPVIFSWPTDGRRERPRYDAAHRSYAVRSDYSRWIARAAIIESGPFKMRAVLSVDGWLGRGGIVWGIRDDKNAFPKKQFRCLMVEYFRLGPKEPAKLAVHELVLTPFSFDDVRKTHGRFVAVREVAPPVGRDAALQVTVDDNGILVEFDDRIEWRPVDLLDRTDWLPDGETAVGITGVGRDVVLRDLSIRSDP